MAIVVRYRCHHCGAARQGNPGGAWVRCEHCAALIAFDWQAWLASKEYAAYLRQASSGAHQQGWTDYQAHIARADALVKKKDLAGAAAEFRAAMAKSAELNPSIHPDELRTRPAWREKWLALAAWSLLQQRVDPVASKLQAELMSTLSAFDYKNPMKHVEKAVELLTAQYRRFEELGPPEDPDGMPGPQRLRATLSQFVGGYLQLVNKAQQRALLERIYGKDDVVEAGDTSRDTLGMFRQWRCPACGLCCLETRFASEHTCMACAFRAPVAAADTELERLELSCGRCGAALVLERGELERSCGHCGTWTRRLERTGAVERAFGQEVMAAAAAKHGFTLETLPAHGKPGLPVTSQNRAQLQASGLLRLATGYHAFLDADAYLALVRGTFEGVEGAALVARLDEVKRSAASEGGTTEALALIDASLARLQRRA